MADGSKAVIQFLRGVDEPVVPDIRVTRSRDGRTGQAIFVFEQPEALAPEVMEALIFCLRCSKSTSCECPGLSNMSTSELPTCEIPVTQDDSPEK